MSVGIEARVDRISTQGRMVHVPMDHGITMGATKGLRDIESTIDSVTRGGADSVLTQKGLAARVHPNKNEKGYIVHLNASTLAGPDPNDKRLTGSVEEAVSAGADAVSLHMNIGSDSEPRQIEQLATVTADAARLGVPVLAMAYARGPDVDEHDPSNLAHAVRLAEEGGADIVKTPFSGDPETFERVTGATSTPVIMAGGDPRSDRELLEDVSQAIDAGAAGVSIGRSIFQHNDPEAMTRAVSAVVHNDATATEAMNAGDL